MTKRYDPSYLPKDQRRFEVHTYKDISLKVYMADATTVNWYGHDFPRNEIDFLKITKDDLVFDIGAHQGVIACILARLAGHVVAVESDFHNVPPIRKNRWANQIKNLSIIHGYICNPSSNYLDKYKLTIDQLTEKYGQPTVIYVDIEGMEGIALRGAAETLKSRPSLCIEMHIKGGGGTISERGDTLDSVFAAIPEGYKFFCAAHQDDCAIFEYDYEKVKNLDAFYLICMRM